MFSSTTSTTTLATLPPPKSFPFPLNRCSLLTLTTTTLSLPTLTTNAAPPPSPPKQPDTTITDRMFLDFSICHSYFQTRTLRSDLLLCPDSEPVGIIVVGLYGNLVPITLANFKAMCTGMDVVASISTYRPGERVRQYDLAEFFGDERAKTARAIWDRPQKTLYISNCGEVKVTKSTLSSSLP